MADPQEIHASPAAGAGKALGARLRFWCLAVPKFALWNSLRLVVIIAALSAAIALGVLVSVSAALRSEAGSRLIVAAVPGLQTEGMRGALFGNFCAKRLHFTWNALGDGIEIENLCASDFQLQWHGELAKPWATLAWKRLDAERLHLILHPEPPRDVPLPSTLALPVGLTVDQLTLGRFEARGLGADGITQLRARLQWSSEQGQLHSLQDVTARWGHLDLTGSAQLQARAPFALQAQLRGHVAHAPSQPPQRGAPLKATGLASPNYLDRLNLTASASGSLESFQIQLGLTEAQRSEPAPAKPPRKSTPNVARQPAAALERPSRQVAQGRVTLRPFRAWPVGPVELRMQGLDLSALNPGLATTDLSGRLLTHEATPSQPAGLDIAINNAAAGLWNEQRWPIRGVQMRVAGDLASWSTEHRVEATSMELLLGAERAPAGRITGRISASGKVLTLDALANQLRPDRIDSRASPVSLSGPLRIQLQKDEYKAPGGHAAEFKTQLRGQWMGLPRGAGASALVTGVTPASLTAQATASWAAPASRRLAASLELPALSLQIGNTSASLKLRARTAVGDRWGPWSGSGLFTLAEINPSDWWPGDAQRFWGYGASRINLAGEFQLQGPTLSQTSLTANLPSEGQVRLDLQPSLLAGVGLSGAMQIAKKGTDNALALNGRFNAAGNEIAVDGQLPIPVARPIRTQPRAENVAPAPAVDSRLNLELHAKNLAPLTPWVRLGLNLAGEGEAARGLTLGGSLSGKWTLDGAWPQTRIQGWMEVDRLQAGPLGITAGKLEWNLAHPTAFADAHQHFTANIGDLAWGERRLSNEIQLRLDGSTKNHRFSAHAASRARPPVWALTARDTLSLTPANKPGQDWSSKDNTVAQISLQGAFLPTSASDDADLPLRGWKGQINHWSMQSRQDPDSLTAATAASPTPNEPIVEWLRAQNVPAQFTWASPEGQASAPAMELGSGRADFIGAAVRWSRLEWQAGQKDQAERIDADVELEPTLVAPILAKLQPAAGWSGDLRAKGRLKVSTTKTMSLDAVLERDSGDLHIRGEQGPQAIGLTDLRLGLNADAGVWTLTQAFAGKAIGASSGAVVVRAPAQALTPDGSAAVSGVFELKATDLSGASPWIPAGWRLGGSLAATASIGGTLASPQIKGALSGQDLSLRSAIDGINWHSGRLALAFDEQHVQINEFSTQSGKGKLGVTGQLRLGPETTGQLQLQADRFTLLGRVDRRVLVSGQGQVQIEPRLAKVAGQFTVDDGFFDISRLSAPSLPSDVVVVRGGAGASAPSESTTEKPSRAAATDPLCAVLGRPCDIQLAIKLGQRIRFQGRGLTAGLTGDLNISGTAARQPRIQGLILMTEDSTYRAYGQNLKIERGRIAVSGPLDAPRVDLDVEATRKLTEFGNANASGTETEVSRVGIALTGPITNLRAKLFSEPDSLSEMEKLSWLLLGRGTDASANGKESALLQQAVVALLQGEGDGLSLSALGLDDLLVSKKEVRVGKQLTDRIYLSYQRERELNTSADSVQLIYSIARQFSLSWQRRDDASNSLQLNWSWRWN